MARMTWPSLLNSNRLGKSPATSHVSEVRSEFDVDVDRLVFSGAFRRLSRKTQVHPLAANDHVHTRLTHSLEVARVGRTLGKRIGKFIESDIPAPFSYHDIGAIVEAACIGHDLGNPPFGHAGEEAMKHWFEVNAASIGVGLSEAELRDISKVEGNAQGFRQITQTENYIFAGGLQLTYATLGAFLKYPWTSAREAKKLGSYLSEGDILAQVADACQLAVDGSGGWCRHPLAHVMEAADDICYAILDLEDAVELKILTFDYVADAVLKYLPDEEAARVRGSFARSSLASGQPTADAQFRVNLTRLRGAVFQHAIEGAYASFRDNYSAVMEGRLPKGLIESLPEDDSRRRLVKAAKDLGPSHIFPDSKKVELELGAYATFDTLLSSFCAAAREQSQAFQKDAKLGWKSQLVMRMLGDHAPSKDNAAAVAGGWTYYQCLRRVIDFITGMTDNYATYVARQLQGGGFSGGQRP